MSLARTHQARGDPEGEGRSTASCWCGRSTIPSEECRRGIPAWTEPLPPLRASECPRVDGLRRRHPGRHRPDNLRQGLAKGEVSKMTNKAPARAALLVPNGCNTGCPTSAGFQRLAHLVRAFCSAGNIVGLEFHARFVDRWTGLSGPGRPRPVTSSTTDLTSTGRGRHRQDRERALRCTLVRGRARRGRHRGRPTPARRRRERGQAARRQRVRRPPAAGRRTRR